MNGCSILMTYVIALELQYSAYCRVYRDTERERMEGRNRGKKESGGKKKLRGGNLEKNSEL